MGWRGVVRGMAAASKRSAKNSERRYKAQQKVALHENSASAVASWEDHVEGLMSLHMDLTDAIDWQEMLTSKRPIEPKLIEKNEKIASQMLDDFKPSLLHLVKGGSAKVRLQLETNLQVAIEQDKSEYSRELDKFEVKLKEWYEDRSLAKQVIEHDPDAQKSVIENYLSSLQDSNIGKSLEFKFSNGRIAVIVDVHDDSVIPRFRRKVLASGKLSETPIPAGQFNELYQDYVASAALKIAGDVFSVLPISQIFVTCNAEMLNRTNGHQESTPILSIQIVRETFSKISLQNIDTSDCLRLFNHRMVFTKKSGFIAIEPFDLSSN